MFNIIFTILININIFFIYNNSQNNRNKYKNNTKNFKKRFKK